MRLNDLAGKRFGRLTVIRYVGSRNWKSIWSCSCDCGKHVSAERNLITSGGKKSCGCLNIEKRMSNRRTHGEASERIGRTREYKCWKAMMSRCYQKSNSAYKNYGERGITVCDRWNGSYKNFLTDMGRAPADNMTIERIDNDGDYSPENCRWATWKEQANNRRTTMWVLFNGQKKSLKEWCDYFGANYKVAHFKMRNKGYSLSRAIGISGHAIISPSKT